MKLKLLLLAVSAMLISALQADGFRLQHGNAKSSGSLAKITGTGTFYRTYNVEPGKDYLFSADVVSNGSLYFRIHSPSIPAGYWKNVSYHGFGKKQKVYGFYHSRNAKVLSVALNINVMDTPAAGVKSSVTNIKLEKVDLRKYTPKLRPVTRTTTLGKNTVIVIPEGKFYQDLAQKISKKISPAPRILTDKQVCESNQPTIRKEYADKDLIILGNLDTNRAIWPAYNTMLAASDAYYPGAQGYEIRTAVDVLSNGRNHIIIGSSSPEGVKLAVEKFLPRIRKELPYLLDVKLSGKCLENVNADIAKWKKFPNGSDFPKVEPGYHTIRRWYHNAIMYYWTGHDFYKKMARKLFPPVLDDHAYTHHYIMEWFFKTWRMVKYTGLHTPEEAKRTEELLFYNFMELQTGSDLYWFKVYVPPYIKVALNSRHVTAPMMCVIESSDYVRKHYVMPSPLKELTDFIHSEYASAFKGIIMSQSSDALPGGRIAGMNELALAVCRFSLKYGHYDVFRSGKAEEWSLLDYIDYSYCRNNVLSRNRYNDKHISSILTAVLRSPKYRYIYDQATSNVLSQGMFVDRFICGIGLHTSNVKAERPASFDRPLFKMMTKSDIINSRYLSYSTYRVNPQTLKKSPFEYAALRGRKGNNQFYLGFAGMKRELPGPGEIVQFSYNKVAWLHNWWTGLYSNMLGNAFERNMLFVNRNMQAENSIALFSPVSSLNWKIDLPGVQGCSIEITPWNGVNWQRSVYMVDEKRFIVYDGIKPLHNDYYDLGVTWRPHQVAMPNSADTLYARFKKDVFSINCSGKGFKLETNTQSYLKKRSPRLNSHFSFHGNLKKGDKLAAAALLQVNGKSRIAEIGNGRVLLIDNNKVSGVFTFTAAGVNEISLNRIVLTNADKVVINGKTLWKNDKKSNILWDLKAGVIYTAFDKKVKVSAGVNKQAQAAAAAYLKTFKVSGAAGASDRDKVAEKSCLTKNWSRNPMLRDAVVHMGYRPLRNFYTFPEPIMLSEVWSLEENKAMPKEIEISLDGKKWTKVKLSPRWQSGQFNRNYGETHQVKQHYQIARVEPARKVKFLRTAEKTIFQFSRSDVKTPVRPVKIYGTYPDILVANQIYKSWPRRYYSETNNIALLDQNGKELFNKEIRYGLHELKILDYPAQNSVGFARADGVMQFYDRKGKLLRELNSCNDLKEFNVKYGRKGIRHPASGFPAVYALGTWKKNELIATRYGHLSFYDKSGKLLGVHHGGTYGMANILTKGEDFNGDGLDQQLATGISRMVNLTASAGKDGRPQQGWNLGASIYWPEIYTTLEIGHPLSWNDSMGTAGPFYYALKRVDMGKGKYLISACMTFMSVYDCKARRYIWSSIMLAPIVAADFIQLTPNVWKGAIAQESGVVSVFTWKDSPTGKKVEKVALPDEATGLCVTPDGRIFASCVAGVYEIAGGKVFRCLKGSFSDIKCAGKNLITVSSDGTVSSWKIK